MKTTLSLLLVLLAGCGAAAQARPTVPTARRQRVDMEELHITARPSDPSLAAYDAQTLFARATELLNSQHCPDAVALYDRIAREFPTSAWLSPALYNAGLCLSDTGQNDAAAQHFRDVIARSSDATDVKHAHLLLSNLLVRTEHWEEALQVIDRALLRTDYDADDREELLARRAQASFGAEKWDDANRDAHAALAYYTARPEDARVHDDFYVSAANFIVAEVARQRASQIQLTQEAVEIQRDELERHARLLLEAQREYFNTIRLGNAHWAAASGYRVGQMYDDFWNTITRAPVPPRPDLSADLYRVFGDEYHRKLREMVEPLLRHAISYWEMTLLMVERTGARNEWVDRTRQDLDRVRAELLAAVPGAVGIAPPSSPPHPATEQAPDPGTALGTPHPG